MLNFMFFNFSTKKLCSSPKVQIKTHTTPRFSKSTASGIPIALSILGAIALFFHGSVARAQTETLLLRADLEIIESVLTQKRIPETATLFPDYWETLCEFGWRVAPDQIVNLRRYLSQPQFNELYTYSSEYFSSNSKNRILEETVSAFNRLRSETTPTGDSIPLPQYVFTHISGLKQNIMVGKGWLSLSLDNYLGVSNKFYKKYPVDGKNQYADPHNIPYDAVRMWLRTEFPMPQDILLILKQRIDYYYFQISMLAKAFPDASIEELLSWSKKEKRAARKYGKQWLELINSPQFLQSSSIDIAYSLLTDDAIPRVHSDEEIPRNFAYWIAWQLHNKDE